MRRPQSILAQSPGRVSRWQTVACFLLIAFLLYNPFVALLHAHDGLSVHQLSRNRATVGASELQHFSPVSNASVVDPLVAESLAKILPVPADSESPLVMDGATFPVLRPDFSSNLWFRPPPAA